MRERRQLPCARADRPHFAIDRYFDQIWPIRFDCRLDHTFEIASTLHYPTPFHVYRRINFLLTRLRELLHARGIESSVP